jgi:hypothetical protein
MSNLFKPGTSNAPSGTYLEVGPNGESINDARVVNLEDGDIIPLPQSKGNKWLKL